MNCRNIITDHDQHQNYVSNCPLETEIILFASIFPKLIIRGLIEYYLTNEMANKIIK